MCLAVPGRLEERFEARDLPMGRVDFNGLRRDVCLAYTPEAAVGDYVVVHVGFAISVVDRTEAERMLALLDELGELDGADVPEEADSPVGAEVSGAKEEALGAREEAAR